MLCGKVVWALQRRRPLLDALIHSLWLLLLLLGHHLDLLILLLLRRLVRLDLVEEWLVK